MKIPKESIVNLRIKGNKYPISSIPSIISNKMRIKFNKRNNDMNPIQQWYDSNKILKEIMDTYYKENIYLINNYKDIKLDMEELYNLGTATEKTQIISVLAFMKKYFKKI